MGPRAALALPCVCFLTVSTCAPARVNGAGEQERGPLRRSVQSTGHADDCAVATTGTCCAVSSAPHFINHERPACTCAGSGPGADRSAPARMAAFTLDAFCAAAAVGRFLLMTTVSQSWLPWRFTAGGAARGGGQQVGASSGGGGRQRWRRVQRDRPAGRSHVPHCAIERVQSPRKATGRGGAARGRQWTAALQWGARAPHRSAATDSCTAALLTGDGCGGRRRGTVSELSGGRGGGLRAARRGPAGAGTALTAAPRPESGASTHAPDAHSRAPVGTPRALLAAFPASQPSFPWHTAQISRGGPFRAPNRPETPLPRLPGPCRRSHGAHGPVWQGSTAP